MSRCHSFGRDPRFGDFRRDPGVIGPAPRRVTRLTAAADDAILPAPAPLAAPLATFGELTRDWDARRRAVAAGLIFDAEPPGTGRLALDFGVTRERIHRLHIHLEQRMRHWLYTDERSGRPFLGHLLALEQRFGAIATTAELRRWHPEHELSSPDLGVPLWQVIATLLPHRRWVRDWLVAGDLDDLGDRTRAAWRACRRAGLSWTETLELLREMGIRPEIAPRWLEYVGRAG
ncbi:hypothetical protein [Nocardia sp. NPDC057668]|uniref:hypothetical protein n=1 Tax=Nocardia sp. NPDC057668 TaxID=3346202 RepID=UPI00366F20F9